MGADPAEGVRIDLDNADDRIVCPVRAAGLGRFFSLWERAIGGACFVGTDLRGAGWLAAAPPGHTRPGFWAAGARIPFTCPRGGTMLEQTPQERNDRPAHGMQSLPPGSGGGAPVTTFLACLGGLLGLVVGSFLNVVTYRIPLGRSVVRPRSSCPACGHEIRAGDNVPVLSWLLLRGHCRDCGVAISLRYPLVEAGTAAALAGLALLVGASWALPGYWWAAGTAIALTLTDLDYRRIPDRILLPGIVGTAALLALGSFVEGDPWAVLRTLAGGAAYFGLLLLVALAARGGFGFGDVKLGFLLGLVLAHRSWSALLVGAFAAFALGGLAAVALLAARRVRRKDAIPFGPAMVAGAGLGLVLGDAVARWYLG